MGKLKRDKRKSLRSSITSSFYLMLGLSVVAAFLTWAVLFIIFAVLLQNERVNPANYYEEQIPALVEYMNEQEHILDSATKEIVEKRIPLEGLDYQVLNLAGEIVYGTITKSYIDSGSDLLTKLNTNLYDRNFFVKYYPLLDEQGLLQGAVGFRYQLSVLAANQEGKAVLYPFVILTFLTPFFYIFFFSYMIGKRLSSRIEKPFNKIIESANRIRNHELDFSLSYMDSTEELNQLMLAFEEMKEALKESLEQQWKLERERKEMVAAIAHDLKTPLTIIQGHVEGLIEAKNQTPERQQRYLDTIYKSCLRSIQLIKELNELSKLEQAEFTLQAAEVNAVNWLREKASQYELLCEEKHISFHARVIDNRAEQCAIWLDVERMEQVIDNVFMNSWRFTPDYGEIKWLAKVDERYLTLELLDSGPGFASKNPSKVFEKFYREDAARSGDSGHSGLGLFIAQTIVKKHGGEISAANHEAGGACVKVRVKSLKPDAGQAH